MIFGRSALLALAIAVAGLPSAAAQGGLELKQLMQELAQVKAAGGKFVERKHFAILDTPLDSSGTLVYVAPGRLEKHVLSPRRESLIHRLPGNMRVELHVNPYKKILGAPLTPKKRRPLGDDSAPRPGSSGSLLDLSFT